MSRMEKSADAADILGSISKGPARTPNTKRDEFRKYLESSGVMEALTKVLVALYELPEKPEDALEFVQKNLYSQLHPDEGSELDNLREENIQLKEQLELLESTNAELSTELLELRHQRGDMEDVA